MLHGLSMHFFLITEVQMTIRSLAAALCLSASAILPVPASASEGAGEMIVVTRDMSAVRIVNDMRGSAVCGLFISPSSNGFWGSDFTGAGCLASGMSTSIVRGAGTECLHDIMTTHDEAGNRQATRAQNVNLCAMSVYNLSSGIRR